jgi:hypothetical protein
LDEKNPWRGAVKQELEEPEDNSERENTNPFLMREGNLVSVQQGTNPFLIPKEKLSGHETESNGAILSVKFTSLGHGLDLLTGDMNAPFQSSTPVNWDHKAPIRASESWDLLVSAAQETFDDPLHTESDIMETSMNSKVETKSALDKYLNYVNRFRRSDMVCNNSLFTNH